MQLAAHCRHHTHVSWQSEIVLLLEQSGRMKCWKQNIKFASVTPEYDCRDIWQLEFGAEHVHESDSSRDHKWSRHLTIRIPGHAFRSNADVGALVKGVVLQHRAAQALLVNVAGQPAKCSLVDTSVYSKCDLCCICHVHLVQSLLHGHVHGVAWCTADPFSPAASRSSMSSSCTSSMQQSQDPLPLRIAMAASACLCRALVLLQATNVEHGAGTGCSAAHTAPNATVRLPSNPLAASHQMQRSSHQRPFGAAR